MCELPTYARTEFRIQVLMYNLQSMWKFLILYGRAELLAIYTTYSGIVAERRTSYGMQFKDYIIKWFLKTHL